MAHVAFGARIARLLEHRGTEVAAVAAAGVAESELQAVLGGSTPTPNLLRELDPLLGVHASDLFVLAEMEVPADLAPLGAEVGSKLDYIVRDALRLPSAQRERLHQFVASVGQGPIGKPAPATPDPYPMTPGPGTLILGMLRNRNLDYLNAAKMLYRLAKVGPLAASTIRGLGFGRVKLTDELISGLAAVLGYPVGDLAAMLDLEPPAVIQPVHPLSFEIAQLVWDMRRLTSGQIQAIFDKAESLQAS